MPGINNVRLGGHVVGLREWTTKDNVPAATLTIEFGESGVVEVLMFGVKVKRALANINNGSSVIVHGKLSESDSDDLIVIADKLVPTG